MEILFVLSTLILYCSGQNIIRISPGIYRVSEKEDTLTIRLVFNQDIDQESRKNMSLNLTSTYCPTITIENQTDYTEANKYAIEFIYSAQSIKCFAFYNLIFVNQSNSIQTNFKIYIYDKDMKLKRPKERYFLVNDSPNPDNVTAIYEFEETQPSDSIKRISCYNASNPDNIVNDVPFNISNDKKTTVLQVFMKPTANPVDYVCDIYPEYSTTTISEYQRFRIVFHEYILVTEAIYLEKRGPDTDVLDNRNISFKIKFKDDFVQSDGNLIIKDFQDREVNYILNGCQDKVCEFFISSEELNQAGKYSIFFKTMQERALYYVLYEKKRFKRCYYRSVDELITITFTWYTEMDYTHNIYLNSTPYKQIHYYESERSSDRIVGNYSTTSSAMSIGLFSMKSSIPSLSFTDYNPVNPDRLYFSIIDDISVIQSLNITLYKNNQTDQLINMTFNEIDTIGVLDEIHFQPTTPRATLFTLSKSKGDCNESNSKSFICNLTEYIQSAELGTLIGKYRLKYSDICNNLANITNLFIEIKQTYNLLSFYPSWINKNSTNGTNITLIFDDKIEGHIDAIEIRSFPNNTFKENFTYYDSHVSIKDNSINFQLTKEYEHGIYNVNLITDLNIDYHGISTFKVSNEDITFNFSHHYFALNGGGRRVLKINATINSNDFGCKLRSSIPNDIINTTENCDKFEFNFDNTGIIHFSYYDSDGFLIPIDDYITIVNTYTEIFSFINFQECHFFKFELIVDIYSRYENVSLIIFLKNINTNGITTLNKTNKNFINDKIDLSIGNYNLFVSETTLDDEVYLFKSGNFHLTNISVPDYIMKPNSYINFAEVTCDLSKHRFDMFKNSSSIIKKLERCIYYNQEKILSCEISGSFYTNSLFGYYYFKINDKDITYNDGSPKLTFASNRLNDSDFSLSADQEVLKYNITIENRNNDFYFPLIQNLVNYLFVVDQFQQKILSRDDLNISEVEGTIKFQLDLKLNDLYVIGNLTRRRENNEPQDDPSFYHNFNYIIDTKRFTITPKIFAYNKLAEKYEISIRYVNQEDMRLFKNISNLKDCFDQSYGLERRCTLDIIKNTNFIEGMPQNFEITIGNKDNNITEIIKFIYYDLSPESKYCKTKTDDMARIVLNVYFPDLSLARQVDISTKLNYIPTFINTTHKRYSLNGPQEDILDRHLEFYINNDQFYHSFTLKDIGLQVLPKYNIILNDNKKILYLFHLNDQRIMATIDAGAYSVVNMSDIVNFQIKNQDTQSTFEIQKEEIDSTRLYIIFNLNQVPQGNYVLNYIDKCSGVIPTDIQVIIRNFVVDRHYFVLNNNNNQPEQIMRVSSGHDIELNVSIYKDNIKLENMKYDSGTKKYYHILNSNSKGNYTFQVNYNGASSILNEIVYVRDNLSELIRINDKSPECLYFYNSPDTINYKISPTTNSPVNDISIFSMYLNANSANSRNFSGTVNNGEKSFVLSVQQNSIIKNQSYFIFLTEKTDTEQPLYVFSYKYTEISIEKKYSRLLYTDTYFIEFSMSCRLEGNLTFKLENNALNEKIQFQCNNARSSFNSETGIYRCELFINGDKNLNNLFKDDLQNGYYNLTYESSIIKENIYLSYEITKINFNVSYSMPVMPNRDLNIIIYTTDKPFYMPYIDAVRYIEGSISDDKYDARILTSTLILNVPYFTSVIYIKSKTKYTINEICREECSFCFNSDCTNSIASVYIQSNIPEVTFAFDKHYINLLSEYGKSKGVNIKLSGEADEIDQIYYIHTSEDLTVTTGRLRKYTKYDFNTTFTKTGKYTFVYKPFAFVGNLTIPNHMVFVTNYFTDLLDFHDDSKGCLFYKKFGNQGILALLTIKDDYPFKRDVPVSDFDLFIQGREEIRFAYEKDLGYQILHEYEDTFNYNDPDNITILIVEKNVWPNIYIYGKVENKSITSFDLDISTNYNYSYKDNIVFKNMYCDLKNIYIQPVSSINAQYSLLVCDYVGETRNSYCNALYYTFYYNYMDDFQISIGYRLNNYSVTAFNIDQTHLIYNSIYHANFSFYYQYPNLTAYSDNFFMDHTFAISIDGVNITDFEDKYEKSVIINLSKNLSEINYINEISRIYHERDRPNTPTRKILNVVINTCPEFHIFFEGSCLTCYEVSIRRADRRNYRWFQNGLCVEECDYSSYAIFDLKNFYCDSCDDKYNDDDGKVYCGCPQGTVKLEEDNICYLPESPEIQAAALYRPNIFCYRIDGVTHNYCNNNNTEKCEITSVSGHDFPICYCKDGFTGKYCEREENATVDLEKDNLAPVLEGLVDEQINENSTDLISKIRGIIYFFELDINYVYVQTITISNINRYIDASIQLIKSDISKKSAGFQIYDIIELAVYFLNYNLYYRERKADDTYDYQTSLDYILTNLHYVNYITNRDTTNFNINSDRLNLITFMSYRKDALDNSFKRYIKLENEKTNIVGFMDLFMNNVLHSESMVLTLINRKLYAYKNGYNLRNLENNATSTDLDEEGIIINFSSNNKGTILSNLTNFKVYLHSSNLNINYDLANYYQYYNIGIYNVYDDCFVEPCYFNKRLDFDLTQKYRKKYVFQKLLLNSENCRYNSFDIETDNIEFLCSKFDSITKSDEDNDETEYGALYFTFKKHRLENENKEYKLLPIKCTNKIDDIKDNIALRVYLVVLVIEIIYILFINVLSRGRLRNLSMRTGLDNDKIFRFSDGKELSTENYKLQSNNRTTYRYVNSNNNEYIAFTKCLWNNLKELHPLFSLTRVSLIQPLILQSWFVVFNVLGLFGFNALLYIESLIEERVYRPDRHNFAYPMRKEFGKIILSILCQMILCVLLKLVVLVPYKKIIQLKDYAQQYKEDVDVNAMIEKSNIFEKDLLFRRILGGVLMLVVVTFFFYYSVVFCGIYIKTQQCWLYASLWSIIWNYVIFSPIYILVISIIETILQNPYNKKIYYIKRLFVF